MRTRHRRARSELLQAEIPEVSFSIDEILANLMRIAKTGKRPREQTKARNHD